MRHQTRLLFQAHFLKQGQRLKPMPTVFTGRKRDSVSDGIGLWMSRDAWLPTPLPTATHRHPSPPIATHRHTFATHHHASPLITNHHHHQQQQQHHHHHQKPSVDKKRNQEKGGNSQHADEQLTFDNNRFQLPGLQSFRISKWRFEMDTCWEITRPKQQA